MDVTDAGAATDWCRRTGARFAGRSSRCSASAGYDQFMTRDGSIVLRKNLRVERWDPASGSWIVADAG